MRYKVDRINELLLSFRSNQSNIYELIDILYESNKYMYPQKMFSFFLCKNKLYELGCLFEYLISLTGNDNEREINND